MPLTTRTTQIGSPAPAIRRFMRNLITHAVLMSFTASCFPAPASFHANRTNATAALAAGDTIFEAVEATNLHSGAPQQFPLLATYTGNSTFNKTAPGSENHPRDRVAELQKGVFVLAATLFGACV